MTFKSPTPPLCRYCGKAIAKDTTRVYFGRRFGQDTAWSRSIPEHRPQSAADAQRHINEKIVSIRWDQARRTLAVDHFQTDEPQEPNFISEVTIWDGESYKDEFFCNGSHAQAFAYAAARWEDGRLAMPAYRAAVAARAALKAVAP